MNRDDNSDGNMTPDEYLAAEGFDDSEIDALKGREKLVSILRGCEKGLRQQIMELMRSKRKRVSPDDLAATVEVLHGALMWRIMYTQSETAQPDSPHRGQDRPDCCPVSRPKRGLTGG
ncbi:MAG TPA: hypothetical protein VGO93_04850 [Candidatus Xenobia bacterium]